MLKMFSTQLAGLFKKLQEKEEFAIEDGARLLAQAPAGQGSIYIFGKNEMTAISHEAVLGTEPLLSAKILTENAETATPADRVLIASRYADDEEAVKLAKELQEKGIPFIAMSTVLPEMDEDGLDALADVHIDLGLTKGLLPDESGNRVGLPTSMAALFIYYGLKFTIEEILEEY